MLEKLKVKKEPENAQADAIAPTRQTRSCKSMSIYKSTRDVPLRTQQVGLSCELGSMRKGQHQHQRADLGPGNSEEMKASTSRPLFAQRGSVIRVRP